MKLWKRKNKQIWVGGGVLYSRKVKAFTLIELLAVIVILAIIAVIATPIILGVINDSKYKAFKLSLNNIEHAYELYATQNNIEPGTEIDISKLPLDAKNLKGKVFLNEEGKIELKEVTDGTYSAEGTLDDLNIFKVSSKNIVVKLNNNGNELTGTIHNNSVNFTLNDISNIESINCDKKISASMSGTSINISGVTENTICTIDTLENLINKENILNIVLLNNITKETINIPVGKTINIDLNGKNIILFSGIQNEGILSLTNSKKSSGEIKSSEEVIISQLNSKTDLNDVKIISTAQTISGHNASAICNNGYLHISGDTYIEGLFGIGCHMDNNAKTIIDNATIKSTLRNTLQINSTYTATIIIKNGKFISENENVVVNDAGTIKINGGTFESQAEAIVNQGNGTINICNGTITSKSNIDLKNITTGTINYSSRIIFTNKTNNPQISNLGIGEILGNYLETCLE